jgi:hypothetical protein
MIVTRKTLFNVFSSAGIIIAVVLFVAGGLLVWGHNFIDSQVHDQLAQQKIFFPPKGSDAIKGPQFAAMRKYAGQQLLTGDQAATYANDFILIHLNEAAGGKTYAQLSTEAMANPNDQKLQGLVATVFKGTTLRGMLLNAYAFSKMGQVAGIASYVMFAGGAVVVVLSGMGFLLGQRAKAKVPLAVVAGQEAREAAAV